MSQDDGRDVVVEAITYALVLIAHTEALSRALELKKT